MQHREVSPRAVAAVVAAVLIADVVALGQLGHRPRPDDPPGTVAGQDGGQDADPARLPRVDHLSAYAAGASLPDRLTVPDPDTGSAVRAAAPAAPARVVAARTARRTGTAGAGATAGSSGDPARQRFERQFPAQARAGQHAGRDPATARWAVLVGVNDHHGRTRDNVGSRQDAEDLYEHLRSLGWREDHIVLLRDRQATRENIVQAIAWLARKTNHNSVAVFSYSGHVKQWQGRDVDGDGEVPDEALWPGDNNHIVDSYFVHRLGAVNAGQLWVNIGGCEAAGFADPGLRREGRLLTFSSREPEKSYEDPSVGNSVWGYYLIDRGLAAANGDLDADGEVTVEEAFAFAAPRATQRTSRQPRGPQRPVMMDDHRGGFSLRVPPKPRPTAPQQPGSGDDDGCGLPICPF